MTLKEKLNLSDKRLNETVKVAGTDYDRRRRLTNKEIYSLKRSYQSPNIDVNYLAEKFGVSPSTIRYHVDPEFKRSTNQKRKEYAFNTTNEPGYSADLANYKRYLLSSGKKLKSTN